jgi:hypothetical protein
MPKRLTARAFAFTSANLAAKRGKTGLRVAIVTGSYPSRKRKENDIVREKEAKITTSMSS